jgi:hypothetical protein
MIEQQQIGRQLLYSFPTNPFAQTQIKKKGAGLIRLTPMISFRQILFFIRIKTHHYPYIPAGKDP